MAITSVIIDLQAGEEPRTKGEIMKTIYTVQFYEKDLRSEGFYEFENIDQLLQYLKMFSDSEREVTVYFRKHEVEHDCDVCCSDSIKETVKLVIEK